MIKKAPPQHAGSDSGSDWGQNEPEWGKTEKWDAAAPVKQKQQHHQQAAQAAKQPVTSSTRARVDSSGWDEPESLNAQNNWTRKDSESGGGGWNDDGDNWASSSSAAAKTVVAPPPPQQEQHKEHSGNIIKKYI